MARTTSIEKKKITKNVNSTIILSKDKHLIIKIDKMIKDFEYQEKYEKCADLLKQKNKIISKWEKRKVKI